MAGIFKPQGLFAITPHKVSMCILIQIYASPGEYVLPEPFSSISQHNRFGMFLLALTKSHDDFLEPKLGELVSQLREISGSLDPQLTHELTNKLSSLNAPDDLFNFFSELRGIIRGADSSVLEDDQISLDPSSNLGIFVRRCLLAFNLLSFEGVCHLLSNIDSYTRDALPDSTSFVLSRLDDSNREPEASVQYENTDLENFVYERVSEEFEARKRASREVPFHLHVPKALEESIEGIDFSVDLSSKHTSKAEVGSSCLHPPLDTLSDTRTNNMFLRPRFQMQGYLLERAEEIEKLGSSFSFNGVESTLRQLRKLAPELLGVHFLRYLNNLYHDDYTGALANLHRYFDYSAGMEGFDFASSLSGCDNDGRYEIALLCLGMMHFHFGHPKQALEVLTEAVAVSQKHNNDSCLAYTLAAVCNLLSEFGISSGAGILGSSYSPMISPGTSLTIQQQLFVLLKRSLNRADSLKLTQLVSSNHLAMAKFGMRHVQRPLLSFGPKASISLKTSPANICKDLRLSCHVISEYDSQSSAVLAEGALSTAWMKNLGKKLHSSVLAVDGGSGNDFDAFQFCAQPCSVPGSVMQLIGSSFLLRSTSWETFGSASLARINALLYVACFADSSRFDDLELAYVKLVQHLAVYRGYKEAFVAFKIVEDKFHAIAKSRVALLKLQLLHERALHRGHLKLAQQVCHELQSMSSSINGVDMNLKTEASLRHARTLLAAKQFSQAADVASALFCMCYKFNMQVEIATVLLLCAEIRKKSGNAVQAIPYALASLSFCQSFNLDLLKASATLTLSELWLSLGKHEVQRALSLLHGAFPMILGHGGLELRARAHITEVKCYLSDPSCSVLEEPELVLDPLKQACSELELLEYHELAAEAFYLMAIFYDKLGLLEEREEAATSFKKHMIDLQNPQESEAMS